MSTGASAASVLASDKPQITPAAALALAGRVFGISGEIKVLTGERDANFRIRAADGRSYVFKLTNPAEPEAESRFQSLALQRIAQADPALPIPRVILSREGGAEVAHRLEDGRTSLLRMLTWVEGEPMALLPNVSAALERDTGRVLGRLVRALDGFDHPAAAREIQWDIRHGAKLKAMTDTIDDPSLRARIESVVDRFVAEVEPQLPDLPWQVVHNDFNPHNLVAASEDPDRLSGVLDFGDMVRTARICDLAVAAAYRAGGADPQGSLARLIGGYGREVPLLPAELAILPDLIALRFATSVTLSHWRSRMYPENAAYIRRNLATVLAGLDALDALPRAGLFAAIDKELHA